MKFTQLYLAPTELVEDNETMRRRISSYLTENEYDTDTLAQRISTEIGKNVPRAVVGHNFEEFFKSAKIKDILSSITVIYEELQKLSKKHRPIRRYGSDFITFVNKVFKEEGLSYLMDTDGSVRFHPDEEFEANRKLTLNSLSDPEFSAALRAFELAYEAFHSVTPSYKTALERIFEANEIIFKKITSARLLSSRYINENKTKLNKSTDQTLHIAQEKIIESFKHWVSAVHEYRHGQDTPSYTGEPALEFTILALSNGAGFLRWLASVAKRENT